MIAMKRDPHLVLEILRFVEQHRKPEGYPLQAPEIEGHEMAYIREHVRLCEEAGFLKAAKDRANNPYGAIERLTWHGHEYLEDNRNTMLPCRE